MAKRRASNVTNNGNNIVPIEEQAKKAPKKVPEPPMEEDLLTEEEMEEMEAEVKPSLWTRIKESKPVQTGKKIGKIGLAIGAGFALCKAADLVHGNRSKYNDDYEDEYDDDSSDTE